MAHIEKRTTPKSGVRYEVRYRAPDGKERSRTLRTRREAERYARNVETDKDRGAWIDPRDAATTFEDWSARWLDRPGLRPGTRAREESVVRLHLLPVLGSRPLGSITPADVRALVATWEKRYAPRTVKRHYGTLHTILAAATDADLIGRNPCRGVKLPKADPAVAYVIDADDLADLAGALGTDYAPMAYIGAVLGLRWGEVAGLRVGRLNLLASTLEVAEQVTRGLRGAVVVAPPKSDAGRRTLALPAALVDMLARHLSRRGLTAANADEFVFPADEGGPLRYENWRRRVWLPAVTAARLDGLRFHDLRRTCATALVAEGVDLKTAQTRLGHSDPRLTLAVYAQATTAGDRSAADVLGTRFMARSWRRPRDIRGMDA